MAKLPITSGEFGDKPSVVIKKRQDLLLNGSIPYGSAKERANDSVSIKSAGSTLGEPTILPD